MVFTFARPDTRVPYPSQLSIAGRTVNVTVRENARAKRLTMRVQPGNRGISITVPIGASARSVNSFIERHRGWLETQIAKQPDRPQVCAGINLPIRGRNHVIIHRPGRGLAEIREDNDVPQLVVRGEERFLPRRVADFLKNEAKRDIDALVAHHAGKVGRKVKSVRYRDTTSRWGSCTSDGALSFSWRIMMAPPSVINYLVAHECAHLREMNHGPKFWALCEELCPDTKRCKQWLKRNGNALQAIEFA